MDELKIKSSYLKGVLERLVNIVIRKKFPLLTKDKHLVINNVEITNDDEDDYYYYYYDINLSVSVSKGLITEITMNPFKA